MKHKFIVALAVMSAACQVQLQHGLDEREANEIVSVLLAHGYEAKKAPEKGKKPTWAIEVDERGASGALRLLAELKLPRPARITTREIAAQGGLIDTPATEKLRQLEALEGDLEQTLETMDGVASASVELAVPAAPRSGQPAAPSKASLLLRVLPDSFERLQQRREELKWLIASSVEGLKPEDVSLLIDSVEAHVVAPPPPPPALPWKYKVLMIAMALSMACLALALVSLTLKLGPASDRTRSKVVPSALREAPAPRVITGSGSQKRAA